jgi:hypothetical protein
MASPVFMSSRWGGDAPRPEVAALDRQLRLRGVPVWRDVRELGAGGLNEQEARRALSEVCCGVVLYFTDDLFESWFIGSVELEAIRYRRDRDPDFFVAAVFDGVDRGAVERLQTESGVDVRAFQGLYLDPGQSAPDQLCAFAAGLLGRYLRGGAPPITAKAETRDAIPYSDPALLHLNWDGLLGDDENPLDPAASAQLKAAIRDVREQLEASFSERELVLSGTMHLSAAFLVGWEFRETTGWTLRCQHARTGVETRMAAADAQGWTLPCSESQNDSQLAVIRIGVSQDPAAAVLTRRRDQPPARAQLALTPPDGTASKVSLDEVDSNALAAAVIAQLAQARGRLGISTSELYLACPWTFAVQLGWMFGSVGEVRVYEATADKTTYYDNAIIVP